MTHLQNSITKNPHFWCIPWARNSTTQKEIPCDEYDAIAMLQWEKWEWVVVEAVIILRGLVIVAEWERETNGGW